MSMNIYERAARAKLRFLSASGQMMIEDLFDLPLTTTGNRLSLDKLAQGVYAELKNHPEVSFVEAAPDAQKATLELKLEILKDVIASKKSDLAAAATRVQTLEEKRRLVEALEKKQGEKLGGMSEEDIKKRLAEIGG